MYFGQPTYGQRINQFVPCLRIPLPITSKSSCIHVRAMKSKHAIGPSSTVQTKQFALKSKARLNLVRFVPLPTGSCPLKACCNIDSRRQIDPSSPTTLDSLTKRDGPSKTWESPNLYFGRCDKRQWLTESRAQKALEDLLFPTRDVVLRTQAIPQQPSISPYSNSGGASHTKTSAKILYVVLSPPRHSVFRMHLSSGAHSIRSSDTEKDTPSTVQRVALDPAVSYVFGILLVQFQLLLQRERQCSEQNKLVRQKTQDLLRMQRRMNGLERARSECDDWKLIAIASIKRCSKIEQALDEAQTKRPQSLLVNGIIRPSRSLPWTT